MDIEQIKNSTILLVDDNAINLKALFDYLNDFGFTVLVAQSGERAFRLIEAELPDLILLDVLMPGIDGFEVCRRLKAREVTKDIPVIFMTALSETVDKLNGFDAGGVDYITKPFQHEEVLARVKAHLTIRKLQMNLQNHVRLLENEIEERKRVENELQREIAEHKHTEEALNESKELFSQKI